VNVATNADYNLKQASYHKEKRMMMGLNIVSAILKLSHITVFCSWHGCPSILVVNEWCFGISWHHLSSCQWLIHLYTLLFGTGLNSQLSFNDHGNSILSTVNQRFYLLNQLQKQGLDQNGLWHLVLFFFYFWVQSKLTYACQAFSASFNLNLILVDCTAAWIMHAGGYHVQYSIA
jgi:hypothetical protein